VKTWNVAAIWAQDVDNRALRQQERPGGRV
jgi:hypothetical protein